MPSTFQSLPMLLQHPQLYLSLPMTRLDLSCTCLPDSTQSQSHRLTLAHQRRPSAHMTMDLHPQGSFYRMERRTYRYAVLPCIIDHGLASLCLAALVALPLSANYHVPTFSLVNSHSILINPSGRVYKSTWNSPSVVVALWSVIYSSSCPCDSLTIRIIPHPAVLGFIIMHHLHNLQQIVLSQSL
jgi:hypothetical protein